jgi:hypothetical protein
MFCFYKLKSRGGTFPTGGTLNPGVSLPPVGKHKDPLSFPYSHSKYYEPAHTLAARLNQSYDTRVFDKYVPGGWTALAKCYFNLAASSAAVMMEERNRRLMDAKREPITIQRSLDSGNITLRDLWYSHDFWTSVEHFLANDYAEQVGERSPVMRSVDGIAPFSPREIFALQSGTALRDIREQETAALETLALTRSPAELAAISTTQTITDPIGRILVGEIGQAVLPTTRPAPIVATTQPASLPPSVTGPSRISADGLAATGSIGVSTTPGRISADAFSSSALLTSLAGTGGGNAAAGATSSALWIGLAAAGVILWLNMRK